MKVLTAAQMRDVDRRTTEECGIPSLELMEAAGTHVAAFLLERFPAASMPPVAVLCGKGNNGGDGLVAARKLAERPGAPRPEVFLFAPAEGVRGDAAVNLQRWREQGGAVEEVTTPERWREALPRVARAGIVVDALLGTGLSGPVEGLLGEVIAAINALPRDIFVLAVDIPSGLPSDAPDCDWPYVRAAATVTFTAPKRSQVLPPNCDRMGALRVVDIGTPRELMENDSSLKLHLLEPAEFGSLDLARRPGAHKGDFGHALIVAGSLGKSGAAVLAALGALRAGAGLVTVATPVTVLPIVAAGTPEMMTEPLEATEEGSIALGSTDFARWGQVTAGKSVLAMGPGLSTHQETQQFVRRVVAETDLPLILDADGLNAFAGRGDELKPASAGGRRKSALLAITPHPGEMARLLGVTSKEVQSRRLETALEAAERWSAWVVLKGHRTVVAAPDGRAFVNPTGNPGMATGGTGDVLTGILAGLSASLGTSAWERVLALGVYLHGLAGDLAAEQTGQASLLATDLAGALPRAWRQLLAELGRT